jgi:TRAP-type transport system periplasmic protein
MLHPTSLRWYLVAILSLAIAMFTPAVASAQSKITLRFGHSSQLTEPNHILATAFAKELNELTKGRVEVKVYPQAQLGDEKALVEQLTLGTVDGTVVASEILVGFIPDYAAIGLPFAFHNYDRAHEFLDGPGGQALLAKLGRLKIKGLGFIDTGFRSIGNKKRPITKPADLVGLKIRVIPSPLLIATQKAMGSSPVPIPWAETISALSQGIVDGVETGNSYYYSARLYEYTKYFSFTNHIYTANVVMLSKATYDRLPPDIQKAVDKAAKDACQVANDYVAKLEVGLDKKIEAKGVKVNTVDPKPFKEKVKGIWAKFEPTIDKQVMRYLREVSEKQ